MNRDRQIELLNGANERQEAIVSKWIARSEVRAVLGKMPEPINSCVEPPKRRQA